MGGKKPKVEKLTQGKLSLLVKDGIILDDELKAVRIPKQQLFAALRSKKVYNLGKVERLYLEACGTFSLYTADENKPGLSVLPSLESKPIESILTAVDHGLKASCNCGNTQKITTDETPCAICNESCWNDAVITNETTES